jgi:hypothetical protein
MHHRKSIGQRRNETNGQDNFQNQGAAILRGVRGNMSEPQNENHFRDLEEHLGLQDGELLDVVCEAIARVFAELPGPLSGARPERNPLVEGEEFER